MHVIVTGGGGFIGSNVADAFLRDGHRVTVFDSLQRPGSEHNLAWLRTRQPLPGSHLDFVQGDVRDADHLRAVVSAPDVHLVFHCAAQTAVTTSLVAPRDDFEINALGTLNVLEAVRASRADIPPILFYTSTNKVYGELAHQQAVETATRYRFAGRESDAHGIAEHEPLDFHSPYGCSKGAADQYVRDYSRIFGLRTVVFRMSCIYGPHQFGNEDQGWLAHFMRAVASGTSLTIYGNGKQVRDLLFVDDLVRAFKLAADHIDRSAGRIYNIGGGPPNSLSVWAELRPRLEKLAGQAVRSRHEARRLGDQLVYVSDTRQAERDFGWAPRVGIDDGLRRLWAWVLALDDRQPAAETKPANVGIPLAIPRSNIALSNPLA